MSTEFFLGAEDPLIAIVSHPHRNFPISQVPRSRYNAENEGSEKDSITRHRPSFFAIVAIYPRLAVAAPQPRDDI